MQTNNHILENVPFKRSPNVGWQITPSVEIWKEIEGMDGRYSISSFGRARNNGYICATTGRFYSKKILNPGVKENLYRHISFGRGSKNYYVHILVAKAFISNPEKLPCVNHKDGDRQNNSIDNLEWVTYSENQFHGHRELSNYDKDAVFDKETGIFYSNAVECAEVFNFSKSHFRNLLNIADRKRYVEAKRHINKRFVRLQYIGIAI